MQEIQKDGYLRLIEANQEHAKEYYLKSLNKTEQQKMLEELLLQNNTLDFQASYKIADLACGGGTLSYHLAKIFPNAIFYLVDYNKKAIELAQEVNKENHKRFNYYVGDMRKLPLQKDSFDLVFCWQALSWFDFRDIWNIFNNIIEILRKKTQSVGGGASLCLKPF